jgi:hypothetical protein
MPEIGEIRSSVTSINLGFHNSPTPEPLRLVLNAQTGLHK